MASVVRNMVEGIGLADTLPENPKYFTQLSIPETLILPCVKPDMEQLISVMVEPVIESVRIIETPEAISNEGQNLSGCKLIIELMLREKVKYVADEPSQPVHAAHFEKVHKSLFIIIPCEVDGVSVKKLLETRKIIIKPYIEDIYAMMMNKRTIFKNITVLVDVTFLNCQQLQQQQQQPQQPATERRNK